MLTLTLAACGGGGGGGGETGSASGDVATGSSETPTIIAASTSTTSDAPTAVEAALPDPSATSTQPTPTNIADGATVSLQCGKTYQGTLDLNGKSNVTVVTSGNCGKANITPGKVVSEWVQHSGNIYSAPVDFTPVQVSISGKPISAAHWPNNPQKWADSGSAIPQSDLDGATLFTLENQSVVTMHTISGSDVDTSKPFYVQGKLWMLDSPGEWAFSDGRLYMWAPDGQSPEDRVWASSDSNGINANNSNNVTIDGVKIFSATDGISAEASTNLTVVNSDIANSARDGIWAAASNRMTVNNVTVVNSVRSGIDGWYSIAGATVTNSAVSNTGTLGKPTPSDAGIMFGDGRDNRIDNVRVTNSAYHGISVLHNSNTTVTNSAVDSACVNLTDCGGIYTGARDQLPLNLRIEGNTVTNVKGREGIAIYLDDSANGVTVAGNNVSSSTIGMMIHNGFDNVVTGNTFASSDLKHLYIAEKPGYSIRNNEVTNNTFNSTNGEQTFNLEGANLQRFAKFNNNTYNSTREAAFSRSWDGSSEGINRSFEEWKEWMGQDGQSRKSGAQ